MSECSYDYRFYFKSPKHSEAVKKISKPITDDDALAKKLGFLDCLDEDSEYLDFISCNQSFIRICLTTSTSSDINHRLIRASKEIGSEFCIVDVFNDQVGEGWTLHLLRGKEVTGKQCDELIYKYLPFEKVRQAIADGNNAFLNTQLKESLDPDQLIDGRSLLEISFRHRNLVAFKLLLKHKADANVLTGSEPSLLLYAAKTEQPDAGAFVKILIQMGADVTLCDSNGASVLWYTWAVSQSLHKALVKRNVPLSRPESAYENDEPIENLEVALEHGDHIKAVEFFKISAKDKSKWLKIAKLCYSYNYTAPVDVLIKNGFLTESADDTIKSLIGRTFYNPELDGLMKLLKLAAEKSVDLTEDVPEIIQQLVEKNNADTAIVHLLKQYPKTPLLGAIVEAITQKQPSYLKLLLEHQSPFKAFEDEYEMPLLHYTIDELSEETLEILCEFGADLSQTYDDQSLLEYCVDDEDVDLAVKHFLLANTPSLSNESAVFYCIKLGDVKTFIKHWGKIKNKASVDSEGNSFLLAACKYGQPKIAQYLLTQNIDLTLMNTEGESALSLAVANNNAAMVQLLLSAGADPNQLCATSLDEEDEEDEEDDEDTGLLSLLGLNDLLSSQFADSLDNAQALSKGATCLMLATSKGFNQIALLLIKHGADVWRMDESNQDALMYAMVNNQNTCVDLILKTPNAAEKITDGATGLINMAAMGCNAHAIKRLVAMGVSANLTAEDDSISPMIIATILSDYTNRYDAIDALLEAGADLGKANSEGKTALIYACMEGNQRAIAAILKAGGIPDHIDKEAKTAYDHFLEHETDATGFEIEKLKPKDKLVPLYKGLVHFGTFLLKRLIPLYILASIISFFSNGLAMTVLKFGLVLLALKPAFKFLLKLRKPKPKKPNFMELGLSAITRAYETNEKKNASNQAIIDSWND